jgi:hypothetical protein
MGLGGAGPMGMDPRGGVLPGGPDIAGPGGAGPLLGMAGKAEPGGLGPAPGKGPGGAPMPAQRARESCWKWLARPLGMNTSCSFSLWSHR